MEHISHISADEDTAYLVINNEEVYSFDIAAVIADPLADIDLNHPILTFTESIDTFAAHDGALYATYSNPAQNGEYLLYQYDLSSQSSASKSLGSLNCICLRKNGYALHDTQSGLDYKGDYLYLMCAQGNDYQLYCQPIAHDMSISTQPLSILSDGYGYFKSSFIGMSVDLHTGRLLILGNQIISVVDPGYGTRVNMGAGENWLMPTAMVQIPLLDTQNYDSRPLQITTQTSSSEAVTGNVCADGSVAKFWGYGDEYTAASTHLFQASQTNLVRLHLGQSAGGDIIITIIDIDPGHMVITTIE